MQSAKNSKERESLLQNWALVFVVHSSDLLLCPQRPNTRRTWTDLDNYGKICVHNIMMIQRFILIIYGCMEPEQLVTSVLMAAKPVHVTKTENHDTRDSASYS